MFIPTRSIAYSQLREPAVKELPQPEEFLVIPGISNQALVLERLMSEKNPELEVGTCFKLSAGGTSNLRLAKTLKVLETLLDRTLEVVTAKKPRSRWIHITGVHDFDIDGEKRAPHIIDAGAGAGAASGSEALATAVAAAAAALRTEWAEG